MEQREGRATTGLLSREPELRALGAFLGRDGATACLVLSGEPGIGKTTLWEAGVEMARAQGYHLLSARTREAGQSFAALADLVDGIGSDVLQAVPGPQLEALEVALKRAAPTGVTPEPFAVSAGFLSALRALAQYQPLLVAIDDVQWLDDPSAVALQFAGRRLTGSDVHFLLSRRTGRPTGLERVLQPAGVESVELGALSYGAVTHLLAGRLGILLPRHLLRRVHDVSRGNPLFALELGRLLVAGGEPEAGAELPVPDLADDVFGVRVDGLAGPLRRVVMAVALSPELTSSELMAVVGPIALEEAVASGLVVVERSRVRPAHPMLAAAARKHSLPSERRRLHLDLAAATSDAGSRTLHLAMATMAPDQDLATAAAAAAQMARARGAAQDAEELAAHALRLTPADAIEHADRFLELARCHIAAGEVARAAELLAGRMEELPPGRARAHAHLLLVEAGNVTEEEAHIELALAEAGWDPEVRAQALVRKARGLVFRRLERIDEAEALANQALSVAEAGAVVPLVVPILAWARTLAGRPIDDLPSSRMAALAGANDNTSTERPLGVRLAFRGQLAEARATFGRLLTEADEGGWYRLGRTLQFQLCELELRSGNVREAAQLIEELEPWALFEENPEAAVGHDRLRAVLGAVTGQPEEANRWATKVLGAEDLRDLVVWDRLEATRALGLVAVLERDATRAAEHFQSVWEHTVRQHIDDPGAFPVAADLVEALVESGNGPRAREVTERLSRLAREQRHPWGLVSAQRCRAVLEAGEDYTDEAGTALMDVADQYGQLDLGFDRARSLLWLGRVQRRARKRSDARRSLETAASFFAQMGCSGWADQAGSELARVSGRRAVGTDGLTPSEQRVVDLLARGLSNREIADQLFVSVYTVETHLSHAYAKLGVSSRGQLVHRLGGSPG